MSEGKKYEIHLDNFDGPLDLLLHLIDKNKMDIYDIPIAVITEQYLQFLDEAREMDLGIAFIPEISWQGELGENTCFLDVVDFDLTRITCIYRNQAKILSPAAAAFYRGLSEMFHL